MYSGEAALSGHNVLQVMYAAKKYLLEGLVKQCSKFLEDEISKENVCTVLKHCLFYDETTLAEKCVAFVAVHPKVVLESPDFLNINETTLHHLLLSDKMYIKPMDALKYSLKWAKSQQKDETELIPVREILGKSLFQILFSSMSCRELADSIRASPDLLNDKEQATLFRYIANKGDLERAEVSSLGFIHREVFHSTNRFGNVQDDATWGGGKGRPDVIAFQVNQDVTINGITLFGSRTAGDIHSVVVELYEGTTQLCKYEQTITSDGTATPVAVPIPTSPVSVRSGTRYTVKVGRDGPRTFFGGVGTESVTTEGCAFSYHTCLNNNGTDVSRGQIPQIMFTKCY